MHDEQVEDPRTRHFKAVFANGAVLTLPAEAWLNQALVHEMMTAAVGKEPAWLDADDWIDLVFALSAIAETEEG